MNIGCVITIYFAIFKFLSAAGLNLAWQFFQQILNMQLNLNLYVY
jgi:hypothetical protein